MLYAGLFALLFLEGLLTEWEGFGECRHHSFSARILFSIHLNPFCAFSCSEC